MHGRSDECANLLDISASERRLVAHARGDESSEDDVADGVVC